MMRNFATGICVAGALSLTVSLTAQTSDAAQEKMEKSKEMTITGCVEQNKSGGYWLTHAMSDSSTMPKGTSGTAMPSSDSSAMKGMSWNLEGGKDLDKHVGHKIEVTGHAKGDTSGDQVKGTTGDKEMQARDFDVSSMKMIASTCP
jgi:hypothetical protein